MTSLEIANWKDNTSLHTHRHIKKQDKTFEFKLDCNHFFSLW